MVEDIDVLVVEPGEAPRHATVGNTLDAVEAAVGGEAEVGCFPRQRVLLVSLADTVGLAPNRCLPGGGRCIRGTFLLCGLPEEGCRFASLTQGQQEEFRSLFSRPCGLAAAQGRGRMPARSAGYAAGQGQGATA